MTNPQRIQRRRTKGWRMPENTVSVCRPGKWGNPFRVGVDGTAAECVAKFQADVFSTNPRVGFKWEDLDELRGKNLACFCPIGSPCHADVLLEWANLGDSWADSPIHADIHARGLDMPTALDTDATRG